MFEVNKPEATVSETIGDTSVAAKSIDEAHEKLMASLESEADPASGTVEATTNDSPKTNESITATTGKESDVQESGFDLTPDEEHLLRRNGAADADLGFYRQFDVAKRNKLLAPLREAQRKTDRYWSLPKAEREKLAREDTPNIAEPKAPDPIAATLADNLRISPGLLKEMADEEGISVERLTRIEDERAKRLAEQIAPMVNELNTHKSKAIQGETEKIISATRANIVKEFPQLSDDKVWQSMLDDPLVVAQAEAIYRQTGDRAIAIRQSLEREAKLRTYNDIRTQTQRNLVGSARNAIRSTPEPSAGSSRGAGAPRRPKTLDEVHAMLTEGD